MFHVKHSDAERCIPVDDAAGEIESLVRWAAEFGLSLSHDQAANLLRHLDLVLSANHRLNLTRITTREEALIAHIVDSLAAVPHLSGFSSADEVADVGTGAGYPGIPIATLLPCRLTLVESIGKKAAFLQEATEALGRGDQIRVFAGRAEELATASPGAFAAVTARAVAALPSLVELASPLLREGGMLIALKGAPEEGELVAGKAAARLVGMDEVERTEYLLPGLGHRRTIVKYERTGRPTRKLPRRTGMAQRRPLA